MARAEADHGVDGDGVEVDGGRGLHGRHEGAGRAVSPHHGVDRWHAGSRVLLVGSYGLWLE